PGSAGFATGVGRQAGRGHEPMRRDAREDRLHVLGMHADMTMHQRPRLRGADERDTGARRKARDERAGRARMLEKRLDVVEDRLGEMHLRYLLLDSEQRIDRQDRLELLDERAALVAGEQLPLGFG